MRKPTAPPFDQRSCCHTPMMLLVLPRFTATIGSTSEFVYSTPVGAVPSQPAANGEGPLTRTRESAILTPVVHIATPSGP